MREIRTSGLMSGEGKRSHWPSLNATAPFLDSTIPHLEPPNSKGRRRPRVKTFDAASPRRMDGPDRKYAFVMEAAAFACRTWTCGEAFEPANIRARTARPRSRKNRAAPTRAAIRADHADRRRTTCARFPPVKGNRLTSELSQIEKIAKPRLKINRYAT